LRSGCIDRCLGDGAEPAVSKVLQSVGNDSKKRHTRFGRAAQNRIIANHKGIERRIDLKISDGIPIAKRIQELAIERVKVPIRHSKGTDGTNPIDCERPAGEHLQSVNTLTFGSEDLRS